jgi:cytochrome oxidase assembly protein ShyY1
LAAILSIALFTRLGYWQLGRAEQKRETAQLYQARSRIEPRPFTAEMAASETLEDWAWRRVTMEGRFDPAHQVLLDNEIDDQGRIGYRVYTALNLGTAGGRRVLADRGCVPIAGSRAAVPILNTPDAPLRLEGQIAPWPKPGLLLRGALDLETLGSGVYRAQVLDRASLERLLGSEIAPYVLRLAPNSPHAYRQAKPLAAEPENRHKGYALQWFALALAVFVTYLTLRFKGGRVGASG